MTEEDLESAADAVIKEKFTDSANIAKMDTDEISSNLLLMKE